MIRLLIATPNNAEPSHHNPVNFIRNGKSLGEMEGYACQLVAEEAIDWLENHLNPDTPFFLNVWFHEPHQKIAAPESIVAKYQGPEQLLGLQESTTWIQSKIAGSSSLVFSNYRQHWHQAIFRTIFAGHRNAWWSGIHANCFL